MPVGRFESGGHYAFIDASTIVIKTIMYQQPLKGQPFFSTWFKLFIAIVSMAVGLIIFKLCFAWQGSPLLTAFISFVVLIATSILIYILMLFVIRKVRTQGEEPPVKI
jgi:hypothetical protein